MQFGILVVLPYFTRRKLNAVKSATGKTVLLIAAAVLLLPVIAKAAAGVRVKLRFHKINSFSFGGLTINISIAFNVINPTNETFTVNGLTGNLYLNGAMVGTASNTTVTTIPANAQHIYSVAFALSTAGIALELLKRLQGTSGAALTAQFSGTVNVEGISLPVSETFSI